MTRLCISILCALCAASSAGPIQPALVPPDASTVIHADLDALSASPVGRELLILHDRIVHDQGPQLADLGLTVADIHDLTISITSTRNGTLLVARTSPAVDDALQRLQSRSDALVLQRAELDGRTVHTFTLDDRTGYLHIIPQGDARLVLLADSPNLLLNTIDRASDPAPPPPPDLLQGFGPDPGAFFFAISRRPEELQPAPARSRLLNRSKTITAQAGERDGTAFAHLRFAVRSPDDASALAAVGQGIVALGRLAATQDTSVPEQTRRARLELLGGIAFDSSSDRVDVRFALPAARLVELMRSCR